jgi:hypothetical protein
MKKRSMKIEMLSTYNDGRKEWGEFWLKKVKHDKCFIWIPRELLIRKYFDLKSLIESGLMRFENFSTLKVFYCKNKNKTFQIIFKI